jgi:hypothetical protein
MNAQPVTIEVDTGSASSWGRPPDQTWLVRLRRADRSIIVTIGLSRTAADCLAERITELLQPDPADPPARPCRPPGQTAQQPQEVRLTG